MRLFTRSRIGAVLALAYILLQFPLTDLKVAKEFREEHASDTFPVSVLQVAVAAYAGNPKIPRELLRGLLVPGSVRHDVSNAVRCWWLKDDAACGAPKIASNVAGLLEQTNPMFRPDIIIRSVERTFRDSKDLIQAGCSITLGTALISILFPAKMGFFAYPMVLFVMYKSGSTPTVSAVLFTLLLALAADVYSVLGLWTRSGGSGQGPSRGPGPNATPGKRRAPRDNASAIDAKKDT